MGLLILAMGLTLNTKAGLGVSPIISLSYAASVIWNRNFGDMTFVLYGVFVLIQAAIHLREKGKAGRSHGKALSGSGRICLEQWNVHLEGLCDSGTVPPLSAAGV